MVSNLESFNSGLDYIVIGLYPLCFHKLVMCVSVFTVCSCLLNEGHKRTEMCCMETGSWGYNVWHTLQSG